jgi:hypothetical protein
MIHAQNRVDELCMIFDGGYYARPEIRSPFPAFFVVWKDFLRTNGPISLKFRHNWPDVSLMSA